MKSRIVDMAELTALESICERKRQWKPETLDHLKTVDYSSDKKIIGRYGKVMFPGQLAGLKVNEITLQAGDTLFIPNRWWHWIYTETPCITINYFIEAIDRPRIEKGRKKYPDHLYGLSFAELKQHIPEGQEIRVWNQETGLLQDRPAGEVKANPVEYLIFPATFATDHKAKNISATSEPRMYDPTAFVSQCTPLS